MAALDSTGNLFPPLFDVGAVGARMWRRRLRILALTAGALALALVYLAVTKPTYTATASLLIDPRDARSTNFETVLPGIGADSAAVASQVFVIQSRDLLMAVFESERIAEDPEFAGHGLFSFLGGTDKPGKDAVFRRFERRVTVERAGLTYVIDVSFKSSSAQKAARIANAIVERYRAGLSDERESANADVNTRLAERTAALQQNVTEADRAVGAFRIAHEILDPAAGGTLKDQIDQLTTQLIDARTSANQATGRYEQAVAAGASPEALEKLSDIVSSAAIDRLRADYNQRAAELANAEAIYQARHPTIRRLRSELSRTQTLMGKEAERIARELKAKRDLANEAVATIEAKLAALRSQTQAADAAQVELRRLEAKAEAARSVLDDMLKRAEETAQMRGLQRSEARVIGVAAPPVQPTWPTPMLLLPVSAALGLLVGCGLAVAGGPVGARERDFEGVDTGNGKHATTGISALQPILSAPREETDREGRMKGQEVLTQSFPDKARSGRTSLGAVSEDNDAAENEDDASAGARPEDLGRYDLPGVAGMAVPARIRTLRRRFLRQGGEAFSRSLLALVRRIAARLTDDAAPHMLLVSSLRDPAEARLACAMIGISLQQAVQNVLVVEFSSHRLQDGGRSGIFINGASGLATIVCPLGGDRPFALDETLTADFDFVLLLAPSLANRDWNTAFFAAADLMLFALPPAETLEKAQNQLRRHLGAKNIGRSATLVIAAGETAGMTFAVPGAAS
ncbi:exopolysaccharide biosynthesis protein [Shinella sp. WSJ-2]|uniref:GumC family protein n=1 Tax=Shinella sp. WSJ-2 TaxID=2303749 RepID=UPI000E3E2896|nr:GumC family protein [Shinella sp. WSJ-2]RFZ87445.1 exopolysaccharide biosynthesis protein [Shinella sp. WSJ-2]